MDRAARRARSCWSAIPTRARPSSDGCPRCRPVTPRATPNASRAMSPTPTPRWTPTTARARSRRACRPSPTAPGQQKSATRCCGRRRAESGSASASDATARHATHGRNVHPLRSPTRASASLRSVARANPWPGWPRPDCRCRTDSTSPRLRTSISSPSTISRTRSRRSWPPSAIRQARQLTRRRRPLPR